MADGFSLGSTDLRKPQDLQGRTCGWNLLMGSQFLSVSALWFPHSQRKPPRRVLGSPTSGGASRNRLSGKLLYLLLNLSPTK